MDDEVDAGDEVDDSDEDLPDDAACGVDLPGKDEVGDSAEDKEPANEEGEPDAGDSRVNESKETDNDEDNAEGDGPVDGAIGDCGERSRGAAHGSVLQEWIERLNPRAIDGRLT